MRAVAVVDPPITILGSRTPVPVFISPVSMAGLGHSEGECNITRGAGAMRVLQGVSLLHHPRFVGLTCKPRCRRSIEDITAARREGQALFYQVRPPNAYTTRKQ